MISEEKYLKMGRLARERVESGEDLGVTVIREMDGMRVEMRLRRELVQPTDEIVKDHSPEYATDNKDG